MSGPRLLVIDDEVNLVASMLYGFAAHGFEAQGASSAADGLAALRACKPNLVLLDHKLPDAFGLDLIAPIHALDQDLPIVMISAHGDIPTAVEAVKRGALDFVSKPFDLEDLVGVVQAALHSKDGAKGRKRGRPTDEAAAPEPAEVSALMRDLRATVAVVARSSTRIILLLGPSGAGKGHTARLMHELSARAKGPFTVVNCAALPGDLLEAELFGVDRGAYTGAQQSRPGLVEAAEGGTLFMDEIGELPLPLQAKLLRFLESRSYRRLGSGREQIADVRVIAASNRDLAAEVAAGRFRADLYYRLNVVPINLPRLAEHAEDVMPLAHVFARRSAGLEGTTPVTFSDAAASALTAYLWPGNIRELANLIERLTILHPGSRIDVEHLPPEISGGAAPATRRIDDQLESTEREILIRALRAANGHKGRAAEALGISRHAMKRRLRRVGLL
ncbi:MAG: sigma-54-dependent Fis family transcriptional regulator [Hyphomicrobiaceae bacterium]|nr:MAG: sigma-54-dependent Fis family transcriptional regulator [Hyphomicrobiaceae bacterium]